MSQLNWTRQAMLAGVLFVLGTTAYWLEYKHKPKQEAQEEQAKKIFQLKDAQIQSVKIHDGMRSVSLLCSDLQTKLCKPGDNSKWELAEPLKAKADESNVNSLVSTLNHLAPTETIDLKDETPEKRAALLREYGLDAQTRGAPTTKRIEVAIQDKGPTTLYLGLPHPIGEGIFAATDESRVYVIPNHFKSNLEHDLTYWRNKKIMTLSAHEITSFELEMAKTKKIKATRKDGLWTLESGPEGKKEILPGDIENIDSLLSGVTFLSAKDFASDNRTDAKAKAVLRDMQPALTFTLQKEGQAPVTLKLFAKGAPRPTKLYATVSSLDPLFELEPSVKDRLSKELKDLRLSKLITTMERFSAKRLEFSGKPLGKPLVLVNTDSKWAFADKSEADGDKVQGTLDKLSGNRIKEFLQGAAIPKGQQEGISVLLTDDKGETKRQLAFWKHDGKLYARDLLSKREEAFLVDSAVQEGLPWEPNFFKKAAAPKK